MNEHIGSLLRFSGISLLVCIGACGGRYDIGDMPDAGAATGGTSGTGESSGASGGTKSAGGSAAVGGSTEGGGDASSVGGGPSGGPVGGGGSTASGGRAGSVGGSSNGGDAGSVGGSPSGGPVGGGGSTASGGSIGIGGSSANAGSGGAGTCAKYPVDASMLQYGTPADPTVVIQRIKLFLNDNQAGFSVRAPDVITPEWAADAVVADLESARQNAVPIGGVERFMGNWLKVSSSDQVIDAIATGATAFTSADATLGTLIAPNDGPGIFEDPTLNQIHPTISGRGSFLLSSLFCLNVPPDPPIDKEEVPGTATMTRRQQLAAVTSSPSCQGCHQMIDPLGSSLEVIDPTTGERRTTDDYGLPIDASGYFTSPSGQSAPFAFTSIDDLAPQFATSCEVVRCFAESYVNEALSVLRLPALSDDELQFVVTRFTDSNFSLRELVRAFAQTPTFLQ